MKKLILISVLFSACSNGRNELMTKLVNQKKDLQDSIESAARQEKVYMAKSKVAIHEGADSTAWGPLADSSGLYYRYGLKYKQAIKAVVFSIDSLEKMK